MEKQKNIIRLSNMILNALSQLKKQRLKKHYDSFINFDARSFELTKAGKFYCKAIEKNWLNSAEKIKVRFNKSLSEYSYYLENLKEAFSLKQPGKIELAGVFAEIVQLQDEFGKFKIDVNQRTISVITEPIVLDDITLGCFEIKLCIKEIPDLYKNSPYRVIALNPNPAGANEEVTHPHVSSERLCEGDGHAAIIKAIEEGRLCDFYTIVSNMLSTYNPESPYISLDQWEGLACYDCGYTIASEDSFYCEFCDREYCADCSSYCQICETTTCLGCSSMCSSCDKPVCRDCCSICSHCNLVFCEDCLDSENFCISCQKIRKENDHEHKEDRTESNTEIHTNSMG